MKLFYKLYNIWLVLKFSISKSAKYNSLEIYGTKKFIEKTILALELLKNRSEEEYKTITNHIGIICLAKVPGILPQLNPTICKIDKSTAFYSREWYASILYREACNIKKYREGVRIKGEKGKLERELLTSQRIILNKLNAPLELFEYLNKLEKN